MDRQDIDALLIGALYGELTPADEARLAAHLESHPADKTALDDLKSAREQVHESRIFELQTDPPQAISAVLLQEAARRAPRRATASADGERESWFHRFVKSFAAHPAMAAAAMLVVVVGVAGTLYMKNGDQFAEKTAGAPESAAETTPTDNTVAAVPPIVSDAGTAAFGKDEVATGAAAGSAAAYDVGLAERQQVDQGKLEQTKEAEAPKADRTRVADDDQKKQVATHAASKKGGYLEVTTPDRMPKEMPPRNADKADSNDGDFAKAPSGDSNGIAASRGATVGGGGAAPGAAPATVATTSPPPPPADYKNAPAKPTTPPMKTASKTPAPAPEQQAPVEAQPSTDTSLIAWAKQQHAAAVQLVRNKDCAGAARIAVIVRNRAYGYFTQNMQDDRDLKGCSSYIRDAVNRDEERASKPKAAKRAADEEAPAATTKVK